MPSILGGCDCACEDEPTCTVTVRATDCASFFQCPPDYDLATVNYSVYYPADAASPTCSGTMTLVTPPSSLVAAVWESPPCALGGPIAGLVRVVVTPASPLYQATDETKLIVCYYPLGSATINVQLRPASGLICQCGPRPQHRVTDKPALTLTTGAGPVTLTNNTAGPLGGPLPNMWVGQADFPVPVAAECVEIVPGFFYPCPGGSSTPVYFRAIYSECGFQIIASYASAGPLSNYMGGSCTEGWVPYMVEACEIRRAAGCISPYADCEHPIEQIIVPAIYGPDRWLSMCDPGPPAVPGIFGVTHLGLQIGAEGGCACYSMDPILYECTLLPLDPCRTIDYHRFTPFDAGDTWTLAEA